MSQLIRLLLVFAAIWAVLRLLVRILGTGRTKRPGSGRAAAPERLVQDPSCGVWVPEHRALKAAGPDGTHYFCSEDCRARHSAAV